MLAQITKEDAALLDSTLLPYLFLRYLPDTCEKGQVRHVVPDQKSGGRLMGEYLLSLGHREIFCLSAGIPGGEFVQRTRGLSNALRAGGVRHASAVVTPPTIPAGVWCACTCT